MKAVTETSKSEKIIASIRDAIITGALKPGDRLLNERELARQLDVGRPLLREVIRSLSILGILETRQGDGTYVGRISIESFSEYFTFYLAQNSDALSDIIQSRIAIESQAVRLACSFSTSSDLTVIERCLADLHDTALDATSGAEADFRFHCALVEASHSASLITVYRAISELMRHSHLSRRRNTTIKPELIPDLIECHRDIYKAIILRDENLAERKLREHFDFSSKLEAEQKLANIVAHKSQTDD
ncbi:FadR/GntR family transcriptional regulator [Pseudohoeflea coraliihabitans]|uniref:FadR family transcriptional regulator n=1 Tax=Pseudohoeflea coraliihabitans TaxID=2860393 RepID=A0ABS6WM70_9HYPH|nr:FadR/GntR family transcriptional regulator [Pseudohoeflea sp. DP4N28-3]MBW3097054.1 FadR family transcriptional regulator [Pseudohoeflea sp. DP4N28-3]